MSKMSDKDKRDRLLQRRKSMLVAQYNKKDVTSPLCSNSHLHTLRILGQLQERISGNMYAGNLSTQETQRIHTEIQTLVQQLPGAMKHDLLRLGVEKDITTLIVDITKRDIDINSTLALLRLRSQGQDPEITQDIAELESQRKRLNEELIDKMERKSKVIRRNLYELARQIETHGATHELQKSYAEQQELADKIDLGLSYANMQLLHEIPAHAGDYRRGGKVASSVMGVAGAFLGAFCGALGGAIIGAVAVVAVPVCVFLLSCMVLIWLKNNAAPPEPSFLENVGSSQVPILAPVAKVISVIAGAAFPTPEPSFSDTANTINIPIISPLVKAIAFVADVTLNRPDHNDPPAKPPEFMVNFMESIHIKPPEFVSQIIDTISMANKYAEDNAYMLIPIILCIGACIGAVNGASSLAIQGYEEGTKFVNNQTRCAKELDNICAHTTELQRKLFQSNTITANQNNRLN